MTPQCRRILKQLDKHTTFADLTDDSTGVDLCTIATDGVEATIAEEQSPDGSAWPALSEDYEQWKAKHYPGKPMGHLDEIMADPVEVAGEVTITPDLASVVYGVSDDAKDHAYWFTEGGRPFWGFTPDSLAKAHKYLSKRLRSKLK
jgi:hypothetical protein